MPNPTWIGSESALKAFTLDVCQRKMHFHLQLWPRCQDIAEQRILLASPRPAMCDGSRHGVRFGGHKMCIEVQFLTDGMCMQAERTGEPP